MTPPLPRAIDARFEDSNRNGALDPEENIIFTHPFGGGIETIETSQVAQDFFRAGWTPGNETTMICHSEAPVSKLHRLVGLNFGIRLSPGLRSFVDVQQNLWNQAGCQERFRVR